MISIDTLHKGIFCKNSQQNFWPLLIFAKELPQRCSIGS